MQHVDEGRLAVTRAFRKISPAPNGLAGRREKHRERPATVFAEVMQCRHVNLVDVGPFLTVDFDVDEQIVHDRGGCGILEALVGHDMAPVASGVADREQDRFVAALGFGKRFRPPGPPCDRIILVLKKIRTGLVGETVFGGSL